MCLARKKNRFRPVGTRHSPLPSASARRGSTQTLRAGASLPDGEQGLRDSMRSNLGMILRPLAQQHSTAAKLRTGLFCRRAVLEPDPQVSTSKGQAQDTAQSSCMICAAAPAQYSMTLTSASPVWGAVPDSGFQLLSRIVSQKNWPI